MKGIGLVIIAAIWVATFSAACRAGTPGQWDVWVEQDGKRFQPLGEVTLKRKPFVLVFSGHERMAYAVLSSVEKSELEALSSEADISRVIRPTNVRMENPDGTVKELLVHAKGAIPSGDCVSQVWAEDAENRIHNFQTFRINDAGVAVARREVGTIDLYVNRSDEKLIPVEKFKASNLYVLLTGLPPVGRMAHTDPKLIAIKFE